MGQRYNTSTSSMKSRERLLKTRCFAGAFRIDLKTCPRGTRLKGDDSGNGEKGEMS